MKRLANVVKIMVLISVASCLGMESGTMHQADCFTKAMQATISIRTLQDDCLATGFLFFNPDGYLLTNEHVVAAAVGEVREGAKVGVRLSGATRLQWARLIKPEQPMEGQDVALLKLDGSSLPYLELGDSAELRMGQEVFIFGYPLGFCAKEPVANPLPNAETARAIIVHPSQSWEIGGKALEKLVKLLITGGPVETGSSGSPVVNGECQVVAMIVGCTIAGGTQNYCFAIPINMVKEQLKPIPLIIADFNTDEQCYNRHDYYFQFYGAFYTPDMAYCEVSCIPADPPDFEDRGNIVRIKYDLTTPSQKPWCGFFLQMNKATFAVERQRFHDRQRRLTNDVYGQLCFWVRGVATERFTRRLKVEIKIRDVGAYATDVTNVTSSWQRTCIPLEMFQRTGPWPPPVDDPSTPEFEPDKPDEFVVTFVRDAVTQLKGAVDIDDIWLR